MSLACSYPVEILIFFVALFLAHQRFAWYAAVNNIKLSVFAFTKKRPLWTYQRGPTVVNYDGAVADDITYGRKIAEAVADNC